MDLPVKCKETEMVPKRAPMPCIELLPASCVVVVPLQCDCMILPQKKGKDHSQENVMLEALRCCAEPGGSCQLLLR